MANCPGRWQKGKQKERLAETRKRAVCVVTLLCTLGATDSTRWTLRMLRVVACSAGRAWYCITPHVPCMRLDPASGLSTSLADCSVRRVHKIEPYMVVWMLLYKGRFYVCGCGLGTSRTDCRVHKIDPYMVVCMLLCKERFYVLYIRLTLIV